MTPDDFARAEELLSDPDGEDCERFASWYGHTLLDTARAYVDLRAAVEALGVIGDGYCFCSSERHPDKASHEPECSDLRSALSSAEQVEGKVPGMTPNPTPQGR